MPTDSFNEESSKPRQDLNKIDSPMGPETKRPLPEKEPSTSFQEAFAEWREGDPQEPDQGIEAQIDLQAGNKRPEESDKPDLVTPPIDLHEPKQEEPEKFEPIDEETSKRLEEMGVVYDVTRIYAVSQRGGKTLSPDEVEIMVRQWNEKYRNSKGDHGLAKRLYQGYRKADEESSTPSNPRLPIEDERAPSEEFPITNPSEEFDFNAPVSEIKPDFPELTEENALRPGLGEVVPPDQPKDSLTEDQDLDQDGGAPDYKDLQNRIRREKDPDELEKLRKQRSLFLEDLQEAGAFKSKSVAFRIQQTLKDSDRTNVSENISHLIDRFNQEDEENGLDPQYRVSGIVTSGVRRYGTESLGANVDERSDIYNREVAIYIHPEEIEEAFTREPVVQAQGVAQGPFGGVDARALGQALGREIMGEKLTKIEKHEEFLIVEEWASSDPQPLNPNSPEPYYIEMTPEEREEFKSRHELLKLARYKRGRMIPPPSLDSLSKTEWGDFSKTETQMLYEIPGVRNAMEIYVRLLISDEKVVNGKSLREAKLRDGDLGDYRGYIRGQIEQQVAKGWKRRTEDIVVQGDQSSIQKYLNRNLDKLEDDPRQLKLRARDAEQIAFNLLYAGSVFESLDSQWEGDNRVRRPRISSDLVHPLIKDQMRPLDALVASLKKDSASTGWIGKFGEWAYQTTQRRNKNVDINGNENIHIIDDLDSAKYWTKEGNIINVPECYPVQLIGSFWEETTVSGSQGEENLLDYLVAGRPIEWDKVDSQGIWGVYSSKLMKAAALWDTLKGNQSLKADMRSIEEWKTNVDNALGKFGKRDEKSIKRWLIYASVGIKPLQDQPKLANPAFRKTLRAKLGPKTLNYLHWNEMLFPWDQPL